MREGKAVRKKQFLFMKIFFKLSEIAQEARKLADKHENRSREIEMLAEKTKNASRQALIEAKDAIFGGISNTFKNDFIRVFAVINRSLKNHIFVQ